MRMVKPRNRSRNIATIIMLLCAALAAWGQRAVVGQGQVAEAVALTETPVSATTAEVRDSKGALRYTVLAPNYRDHRGDWRKAMPELRAVRSDSLACTTGVDKYAITRSGVQITRRSDGTVLTARPVYLTRWKGKATAAAIIAGSFETAGTPTLSNRAEDTCAMAGVFTSCDISPRIDRGGRLVVRHNMRCSMVNGSDYYGVVWEVSAGFADHVRGSGTAVYSFSDGGRTYLCEYFPALMFGRPGTESWGDYDHEYSTVGGTVSGTWSGTVNISAMCEIQNNSELTVNPGTVIKIDSGLAAGICLFGSSSDAAALILGAVDSAPVYVTSADDTTIGETISGANGTPAARDYGSVVTVGTDAYNYVTVCNTVVRYGGRDRGCITFTYGSTTSYMTVDGVRFSHCAIPSGLSYYVGLVGSYRYFEHWVQATYRNIVIDSTCVLGDNTYALCIWTPTTSPFVCENNVLRPSKASGAGGIFIRTNSAVFTDTISNCVISVTGASGGISAYGISARYTITVRNCVFDDCTTGVNAAGNVEDSKIEIRNSIFRSCSLAHSSTATPTCPSYNCGYWANTSDGSETRTNPIAANPLFRSLPTGATVASSCVIPTVYAVGSRSYYRHGSTTFNAAGIDETYYSATGYDYLGTDTLTPGVNYYLTAFASRIDSVTPATGTTAGGTAFRLRWQDGGDSGTVKMDTATAVLTSWDDTLIVGTSGAYPTADTVDVVAASGSNADTLSSGWTYTAGGIAERIFFFFYHWFFK